MKLAVLGIILIVYNVWTMKINEQFGNKMMEDFLKKFKTMLKNGDKKLGMPVLDPFNADQLALNYTDDEINLNTNLTKVNVKGLSEYDIINADLKMSKNITVTFHLSWPTITANTNYAMKGTIDVFEIFGNGKMNLSAQYFDIDTEVNFLWDGKLTSHLKVKDMKLKISLKKLDFQATGLFNDNEMSAILSALISDLAPKIIGDDIVINRVIRFVTKVLDNFLSTKTVLQIIQMIL